ncbi:hypothetical protein P22_0183 [Propionispora sp. 2/2-37]|uniref:MBL fold metallo-hydrolase n=1 Tax=Propionispora sp. 2/2-37 TaxID=1677858 RepID=UPI0006BB5858|nr:MBL fold metallo-hydrolase [Propionispora sp. 2/2-37]CUH94121.1 hypothetical protein P22_0183 [Propionispora sp. 2/2-37]
MGIVRMEVGPLGTNCYIFYCNATMQAAVIDPGGSAPEIIKVINDKHLEVAAIINTHGHADHIGANSKIKKATGAPIYIHPNDAAMLTSARLNLSAFMGNDVTSDPADHLLQEKDTIRIGKSTLTVLFTPGHTPGGICLQGDSVIFSGDTLFAESVGRTDLPGGSGKQLINSIQDKLMILPDEYKVLPGHGPETSIGWERKMNPFIR